MDKHRLRVGFLSVQNYLDKNTFSGTLYYMYQALASTDIELIRLGKPQAPSLPQKIWNRLSRHEPLSLDITAPNYAEQCKAFEALIAKQLKQTPCDVLYAPVAASELMCVNPDIPIVYLSDTTFRVYNQLYEINFTQQQQELSEQSEAHAIARANQVVYSSEWAANSAIQDYGADPRKVHVVAFGANLDDVPAASALLTHKHDSVCRLLFVGKDWKRKGGNIAFDCLKALLNMGVNAELVMIGCTPPDGLTHENLTVIPFLNKNVPKQRKQLNEIYLRSNFLLFPTRADCSPIAICEANSFGLPVITTNVGGVPSIIRDGVNGYMLPLSAPGEEYAKLIAKSFADSLTYQQLVKSSRQEYDDRLNWASWAKSIRGILHNAAQCNSKPSSLEQAV